MVIDGVRIDDNAVVSARPVIDVLVVDDNRSLLRRDTTGLTLALQRPGQIVFKTLSWRNATMQPVGTDNIFRIQYQSDSLVAGTYRLRVTAQDAVGNVAPPYQARFQVVNEQNLTVFTVYPNPFREQTLFTFVLTGSQPPKTATLTITNLAGPHRPSPPGESIWPAGTHRSERVGMGRAQ